MDIDWKTMLDKMLHIQTGLLRFYQKGQKKSILVKLLDTSSPSLLEVEITNKDCHEKLNYQPASLSQITEDGYFFISGIVTSSRKEEHPQLHLNVQRAQWFVRKGEGSNRWLEEICCYE